MFIRVYPRMIRIEKSQPGTFFSLPFILRRTAAVLRRSWYVFLYCIVHVSLFKDTYDVNISYALFYHTLAHDNTWYFHVLTSIIINNASQESTAISPLLLLLYLPRQSVCIGRGDSFCIILIELHFSSSTPVTLVSHSELTSII